MKDLAALQFLPKEHVTVSAYGLNAPGRVQECVWTGDEWQYDVEYAIDSDIRRQRFLADELEERDQP